MHSRREALAISSEKEDLKRWKAMAKNYSYGKAIALEVVEGISCDSKKCSARSML